MIVPSNVETNVCSEKYQSAPCFEKKSFLKICLAFFAAASQSDLRKRFAVPNDKFLKYVFSFGARNACVIIRRHVLVTSYVVATRILSHTVSVSASS